MQLSQGSTFAPALLFVIVIPTYKEQAETLRTTLRVLAAHPRACSSYHVRYFSLAAIGT